MSGSWVIGVYGDTASSFSLTVVYEDQKMIDLKLGVPVEMSLEESSFMYFKYLHEFEKNLEINFNQFSGQLNLYVISIDMNQDFVANIPDQAHHKWQVSGQSVITIPMQNQKACVSCVYIMRIEALSSSKFSLVINELDDILPIKSGFQYDGLLNPQESATYVFKSSNENYEFQLNIKMKGMILGSHNSSISLTDYLWRKEITSEDSRQTIPVKTSAHEDSYFLLYNPTKEDLDFSFTLTPKAIIMDKLEQIYYLDPNEKKFFEYSWTEDARVTSQTINGESFMYTPTDVDVIFYATHKEGEDKQKSMEVNLKQGQGQTVKAISWPGRSTSDEKLIFSAGSAPQVKSNNTHSIVRQRFSGQIPDRKGRYVIEKANPWQFKVGFRLAVMPGDNTSTSIIRGEHVLNGFGLQETFQKIPMSWYLWVHSCDIPIDLKINGEDLETGMVTIPKGESYQYRELIRTKEDPNAKSAGRSLLLMPNNNYAGRQGKYFIYSFQIDEKNFKNYEVKKDNLEIQLSQQKTLREKRSQVIAKFKSVEFNDAESSDEVVYEVQLCSHKSEHFAETQLCWYEEGCVENTVRFPAQQRHWITVDSQAVNDGKYSVKVKATFVRQSQPIKFVRPYVMAYIDVNYDAVDEVKPVLWSLVLGIAALAVILVGFLAFRKLKTFKENRGLELQKMEISQRGYNPLDDEGGDEETKNEESQQ